MYQADRHIFQADRIFHVSRYRTGDCANDRAISVIVGSIFYASEIASSLKQQIVRNAGRLPSKGTIEAEEYHFSSSESIN